MKFDNSPVLEWTQEDYPKVEEESKIDFKILPDFLWRN